MTGTPTVNVQNTPLVDESYMTPAEEQDVPPTGEMGTSLVTQGETSLTTQDDSDLTPQNGVPLVIVRVDETNGNKIADMNDSNDHSVRCESATVEILTPNSSGGGYTTTGQMTLDYIRGRGNSTWTGSNKKPYKFQLSEKKDLFGMGESEDWALLANSFDATLMRNQITFWLGEQMGLSFTPQQVPVDLVMVGSTSGMHKYGSYCLCETAKIEPDHGAGRH